jgi:hypothetical protein
MTKKKINIVLFILVIGVWGAILYNVVNRYFIKDEIKINSENSISSSSIKLIRKDTFAMEVLNRDPFLDIEYKEKKTIVKNSSYNNGNIKKVVKSTIPQIIPKIYYYGYITTESNQSTALLKIDNKKVKLVLNQEHDGVKLMKMYRDSVVIAFNKEHKVIVKQK